MCARSVLSDSATPWAVARQAPLSMRFGPLSWRECCSGLPFPPSGDLPGCTQSTKSLFPVSTPLHHPAALEAIPVPLEGILLELPLFVTSLSPASRFISTSFHDKINTRGPEERGDLK